MNTYSSLSFVVGSLLLMSGSASLWGGLGLVERETCLV